MANQSSMPTAASGAPTTGTSSRARCRRCLTPSSPPRRTAGHRRRSHRPSRHRGSVDAWRCPSMASQQRCRTDWAAFDLTVDVESQLEAASGFLDPAVWSADAAGPPAMLAAMRSQGMHLASVHATTNDNCRVFCSLGRKPGGSADEQRHADDRRTERTHELAPCPCGLCITASRATRLSRGRPSPPAGSPCLAGHVRSSPPWSRRPSRCEVITPQAARSGPARAARRQA